jgi:RND family efflux transporter MFP subunit
MMAGFAVIGSAACSQNGGGATQQLVRVARGDITVAVSGSGTLEAVSSRGVAFKTAGQIQKVYVGDGQKVVQGDRIAGLDTAALELAVSQAEFALAQSQASVTQADAALKASQLNLSRALGRITVAEVEAAQAELDGARAYLQYVISNTAGAGPAEQATWANALVFAQAKLAAAQARFNALTTNTDTEEVTVIRMQVAAATESAGLAHRSVTLAQQTLDQAKNQLDEATLRAPLDGTVARLRVKQGDSVSPAIIVAEIVDTSAMQLEVQVDEIDVVSVMPGQKTLVELDALPSLKLDGRVDFINLLPDLQSGVVVYGTRIGFAVPQGAGVRVGMSATAEIVIAERKGVLLVPDRAIGRNSLGKSVVTVSVGGKVQEREIATGISDGVQTEVLSGLDEGETVVVEKANQQASGLF